MTARARVARPAAPLEVVIVGRGKVGRALAAGLAAAGRAVALVAGRSDPARWPRASVVWLAVPDGAVGPVAEALSHAGCPLPPVALHAAGALGPSALEALASRGVGVAQAHPLLSFASPRRAPAFSGAALVVRGDRRAEAAAGRLARALGMRRVPGPSDPGLYHAGAALAANGAAALVAAAARLLEASGLPAVEARRVLGPLLASVAWNVERLGLPGALTGPVRRGDASTVARHLAAVARHAPDALPLVSGSVLAQVPLARALGEAKEADLLAIERAARSPQTQGRRRGPRTPTSKNLRG